MDFNSILQQVHGTGAACVIVALIIAVAWVIVTIIKS